MARLAPKQIGSGDASAQQLLRWNSDIEQWVPSLKSVYDAVVDPTSADDETEGYEVGSIWVNVSSDLSFICVDALEDNAVWKVQTDVGPTTYDKGLTAEITDEDDHLATMSTISGTPINDSYVQVAVNGVLVSVGDGAKDKCCYFSDGEGGARSLVDIASGDALYWMSAIAGYGLDGDDVIDFYYTAIVSMPG